MLAWCTHVSERVALHTCRYGDGDRCASGTGNKMVRSRSSCSMPGLVLAQLEVAWAGSGTCGVFASGGHIAMELIALPAALVPLHAPAVRALRERAVQPERLHMADLGEELLGRMPGE